MLILEVSLLVFLILVCLVQLIVILNLQRSNDGQKEEISQIRRNWTLTENQIRQEGQRLLNKHAEIDKVIVLLADIKKL